MEAGSLNTLVDNIQRDNMTTMRDMDRSGGVRHKATGYKKTVEKIPYVKLSLFLQVIIQSTA